MHGPDRKMAVWTGQRTEILSWEKKTGRSVPELDFKQKRESMRGVHLRRGKAKCRDTNWESCGFFFLTSSKIPATVTEDPASSGTCWKSREPVVDATTS